MCVCYAFDGESTEKTAIPVSYYNLTLESSVNYFFVTDYLYSKIKRFNVVG